MLLASFEVAGTPSYGIVDDGRVIDVGEQLRPRFLSLKSILHGEGKAAFDAVTRGDCKALALSDVTLLPVIPDPGKVFNLLQNYESVRLGQGRPKLQHPHLLTRFADCQVGGGASLLKPKASNEFDYEAEIAVIVGRPGRAIAADQAMQHVAGYACYNDATPRDWMRHTRHFTAAKNFPGTAGFGPWMLTADAVECASDLKLTARLNGVEVQTGNLGDLSFSVAQLISYISSFTPLDAGDVIATGSPGGSGFKRIPPVFLKAGDVVEVEVSGIGVLRNPIMDEAA